MNSTVIKLMPPLIGALVASGASRHWRGFNRIHSMLDRRRARFVNSFGLLMALDPSQYIDSHIIKSGYYEREVLDSLVCSLLSESDVV